MACGSHCRLPFLADMGDVGRRECVEEMQASVHSTASICIVKNAVHFWSAPLFQTTRWRPRYLLKIGQLMKQEIESCDKVKKPDESKRGEDR